MDHSQAVEQMAAERYLLNELPPEAREAFEEHVFDCHECAVDIRAAAAFVDEAKALLPALTQAVPSPPSASPAKPRVKRDGWFIWLRPAFAVPVFATLLLVLGYQNLVTFPALRTEANEPRLLPSAPLHGATRGGSGLTITADRKRGVALPLEISEEPGVAPATSYSFDLLDSQGKLVWTGIIAAPPSSDSGDQRITLAIPGAMLQNGSYTVAVSSVGPQAERTPIERYVFAVRFID
ncbi:MAG: zf-HC2 domain-containing protein [Candidatus Acidiferrales bacterium]